MKRRGLFAVLGTLVLAAVVWAAGTEQTKNTVPSSNASFLSDLTNFLKREDAQRYADSFSGYVISGGVISTGAGLTKAPTALTAYPGGFLVTETGSITFQDATTTFVIAEKSTAGNVGVYVRVAGTHYLTRVQATEPTLPADSVSIAKVVTAGGSVSTVTDLRLLSLLGLRGIPSYTLDRLCNTGGACANPAGTAGRLARVTDDHRGIVVDTGTQWVKVFAFINAKDFDATGNGVTDDTTALTNWLTALGSGNFEGTISGLRVGFLPAGKYVHTSTLTISADSMVFGVLHNSVFLPTSAISTAVIQASGSVLQGVVIDGVNAGSGKTGLSIGASSLVNDGTTRDVLVARFTGVGGRGLLLKRSVNWRFDNFSAWDNEDGAVLTDAGQSTPSKATFTHSTFKSNDRFGLLQTTGTQILYDAPLFELNGEEGLRINDGGIGPNINVVTLINPYFEENQQNLAVGAARHAAYQMYGRAVDLSIRDGYFNVGATTARALHLESAAGFLVDHIMITTNEAGQILVDGSSGGSFVNWVLNNGEFQTVVTDTALGARLIDALEGTWVPTITFVTPGDLAVTYAVREGQYTRIGNLVTVRANIKTATFTHTTASGDLRVTGLPYTSEATANKLTVGQVIWQGITKAGFTSIGAHVGNNLSYITFVASGSNSGVSNVLAANMPTAGDVILQLTLTYEIP